MRSNHRHALTACLVLSSALFTPVAFAQIYNNGPFSTGATAENGAAAPAGATWSEMQHNTGNTTEANTSLGYGAIQGSNRLADDFTVPAGQNWTINAIELFSYKTSAPATPTPFTAYSLQIWRGRPGDVGSVVVCGDLTTNVLATSTDALIFRTANTVVPAPGAPGTTRRVWRNRLNVPAACAGVGFFTPGNYWLDWASTDSAATTHFDPPVTIVGSRGAVGANARQFTTVWADVFDTGTPATAPDVLQDFPFLLFGALPVDLQSFSVD